MDEYEEKEEEFGEDLDGETPLDFGLDEDEEPDPDKDR